MQLARACCRVVAASFFTLNESSMPDFTLVAVALGIVAALSLLSGFFASHEGGPRVREYLLANQSLPPTRVSQLLLSASFSLNGMLYQCWLGYKVGLWALLIQGVWASSYFMLSRYCETLRNSKGLHAFLDARYGSSTRLCAATCSAIGMTVLIGWEFMVGRSTFARVTGTQSSGFVTTVFLSSTIGVSLVYTALGGLRGNAFANQVQNIIKLLTFLTIIALMYAVGANRTAGPGLIEALTPSPGSLVDELGWFGLITNLAFSAVWQFVDMSTWQSVVASRSSPAHVDAGRALRAAGYLVFLAPGVVGTIIGAMLSGPKDVTQDTIMPAILATLPAGNDLLTVLVFMALFAALMSTIDGLLLAASYTLTCDVIHRRTPVDEIDAEEELSQRVLTTARTLMIAIAILGTIGVAILVDVCGVGLFDIVYWAVAAQLSLTGPVVMALMNPTRIASRMHHAVIAGLTTGAVCLAASRLWGLTWMETGSGTFTMLVSVVVAAIRIRPVRKQS